MTLLLAAALSSGPAAAFSNWPEIPFPPGARVEAIGDRVRLDGVPMRMRRIVATATFGELVDFYRDALGPRHAEKQLPGNHVLSQRRGDYFITVRVKRLSANRTEAFISTSDMLEARNAAARPQGFSLPAGSVVLSDMESTDADKQSRLLVLDNEHAIATNVGAFSRELAVRGMKPDGPPLRSTDGEHVQLFAGDNREARLALVREDGRTHAVLTMVFGR